MKTPVSHDGTASGSLPDGIGVTTMPEWMAQALQQGVKPEHALAFIGLGLMNGLAEAPSERSWFWDAEGEASGAVDGQALRQRLEALQLALQTGAPLSTAEVAHLLGARPGAAEVQRGGVTARRMGRNLWKLSRSAESSDSSASAFRDGFRRRL
ncbi:MAG: hypothetical protein ACK52U_03040 [Synechococcaceae cyanobacterium]|jgi:hypothetical protein